VVVECVRLFAGREPGCEHAPETRIEHAVVARRDRERLRRVHGPRCLDHTSPAGKHEQPHAAVEQLLRGPPHELDRRGAADAAGVVDLVHLDARPLADQALAVDDADRDPAVRRKLAILVAAACTTREHDHEGEQREAHTASLRITLPGDPTTPGGMEGSNPSEGMLLQLSDPAATERLAAFLRSLGQTAEIVADGRVDLDVPDGEAAYAEVEIYLRVWRVLNPMDEVTISER
jgi:hypothetical protein